MQIFFAVVRWGMCICYERENSKVLRQPLVHALIYILYSTFLLLDDKMEIRWSGNVRPLYHPPHLHSQDWCRGIMKTTCKIWNRRMHKFINKMTTTTPNLTHPKNNFIPHKKSHNTLLKLRIILKNWIIELSSVRPSFWINILLR